MKKIIILTVFVLLFVGCSVFDMYDGEDRNYLEYYAGQQEVPCGQVRTKSITDYEICYKYWENTTLVKMVRLYTPTGHRMDWYSETIIY